MTEKKNAKFATKWGFILASVGSAVGMANGILLLLRYSEQWIAWLITTVIYLFMDISQGAYILLIGEIAMLVNTIYGIVKWYLYTKNQEQKKTLSKTPVVTDKQE